MLARCLKELRFCFCYDKRSLWSSLWCWVLASVCVRPSAGAIEVVTVSDNAARAVPLQRSCPFPVRHLQAKHPWRAFQKYERLLHHLRREQRRGADEDRLVIFVDAFDVRCLDCPGFRETPLHQAGLSSNRASSIEEVFRSFQKTMFFSAEFGFFPWGPAYLPAFPDYPDPTLPHCGSTAAENIPCRPKLSSRFSERVSSYTVPAFWPSLIELSSQYRFANSGCFGGTPAAFRRFLSTVLSDRSYWRSEVNIDEADPRTGIWDAADCITRAKTLPSLAIISDFVEDQIAAQNYFLRHPRRAALDLGADICMSLYGMTPRHFTWNAATHAIQSTLFRKPICLAHANGGGKHQVLLRDLMKAKLERRDPADAWSTAGHAIYQRTLLQGGRQLSVGPNVASQAASYVDLAQCFETPGVLDVVSFLSPQASFQALQIQVWRPRADQPLSPSVPFLLVAQSDPTDADDRCSVQMISSQTQRASSYINGTSMELFFWEVDVSKHDLSFEVGDCLGWSHTSANIFAAASLETRMHAATVVTAGVAAKVGSEIVFQEALHRRYAIQAQFFPHPTLPAGNRSVEDMEGEL